MPLSETLTQLRAETSITQPTVTRLAARSWCRGTIFRCLTIRVLVQAWRIQLFNWCSAKLQTISMCSFRTALHATDGTADMELWEFKIYPEPRRLSPRPEIFPRNGPQ